MSITIKQLGTDSDKCYTQDVHKLLYNVQASDVFLSRKGTSTMITKVAITAVPVRHKAVSRSVPEMKEVLTALEGMKKGEALQLTLSPETIKNFSGKTKKGTDKIAARIIAAKLKRHFKSEGLAYIAYTNDDKVIFVMREKEEPEAKQN